MAFLKFDDRALLTFETPLREVEILGMRKSFEHSARERKFRLIATSKESKSKSPQRERAPEWKVLQ